MPSDFHATNYGDFSDIYGTKQKTIEEQLNELKYAETLRGNVVLKISSAQKTENARDSLNAFALAYAVTVLQNAEISNFEKLTSCSTIAETIKLAVNSVFEPVSLSETEKYIDYAEETKKICNNLENNALNMLLLM